MASTFGLPVHIYNSAIEDYKTIYEYERKDYVTNLVTLMIRMELCDINNIDLAGLNAHLLSTVIPPN